MLVAEKDERISSSEIFSSLGSYAKLDSEDIITFHVKIYLSN